ncbi:MAG: hypothetical protein JXN62_02905 [Bacteroidales bacterium]|nr:hypothetical protein [Bacteroidales bacterium]
MKLSIEKIRSCNSVMLFLLFIAAGIFLLAQGIILLINLFPGPVDDGIVIVTNDSRIEVTKSVNYRAFLRDTYVFSLESNVIEVSGDIESKTSMLRYESAPVHQKTVNFYFVSKDDKKEITLLAQDGLIVAYQFINDNKADGFLAEKNIYAIASADTNNDERLSVDDTIDLFVSDYNGLNVVKIGSNVYGYTLVADNTVLFTEVSEDRKYFKMYDCSKGTVEEIYSTVEVPVNKEFDMIFY